ncbi:MAG TPA: toll/interleukin-1 receptor domain-containing protein [Verrucomicrobiales bacterium]|jgi:hypothetical protein|nr:toll/interleukin-1 receptor domain-containing protein [Verrucomicrobiales bacterium]
MSFYQLVFLGPDPDHVEQEIVDALQKNFVALGMAGADLLQVLHAGDESHLKGYNAAAAVWLAAKNYRPSGASGLQEKLLQKMMASACPVFPVVDSLDRFPDKVPPALEPVNGIARDKEGWLQKLTGGLLAQWGLTRVQRRIFISYRRSESTGVAGQLLHALMGRGYGVFLDTVSVEPGALFQEHLWDSMSDVDLVVFLASPEALTSTWVQQEIINAAGVGLGVVQVTWPGAVKTDLQLKEIIKDKKLDEGVAIPFHLALADFPNGATREAVLPENRLQELLTCIEDTRIESLGARRQRITGSILDEAGRRGFTAIQHPGGVVELMNPETTKLSYAFVLPGLPDAVALHDWELTYDGMEGRRETEISPLLIYNQIGLTARRRKHLGWLNSHCPLRAQSVEKLDGWFSSLS